MLGPIYNNAPLKSYLGNNIYIKSHNCSEGMLGPYPILCPQQKIASN